MDEGYEQRLRELEVMIREVATAFWGDDTRRDNGLRSDVRRVENREDTLEENIRSLRNELTTYINVDRKKTCYGLEAIKESNGEDTEVKVAKINGRGNTIVGIMGPLVMLLIFLLERIPKAG